MTTGVRRLLLIGWVGWVGCESPARAPMDGPTTTDGSAGPVDAASADLDARPDGDVDATDAPAVDAPTADAPTVDAPSDAATADAGAGDACTLRLTMAGAHALAVLALRCAVDPVSSSVRFFDGRVIVGEDTTPIHCGAVGAVAFVYPTVPIHPSVGAQFQTATGVRFGCAAVP